MINNTKKKISWLVTFIRGDHPEYGTLKLYVFAANAELAKNHILASYGAKTQVLNIE